MSRLRLIVGTIIVLTLVVSGYQGYQRYLAPVPPTPAGGAPTDAPARLAAPAIVTAEGQVIPAREAMLAFRLSGRAAEILVAEGEAIQEGAVLIRLESADLEAAVAQAEAVVHQTEAAVALAQARLDQLLAGPRPEEIAAAQAQYQAAQSAVGQAAAQRDQVTQGPTEDAIAAAEAQLAHAQAQQKELQIAYDKIIENIQFLAGPTEEKARFQLNAANQAVAAAQAALDQIKAGASQQTVRAYTSAVGVAAYQRDAAQAQLALLQAGPTQAQAAAARAQVAQAEGALEAALAGLDAARAHLAQAALVAPFAGVIVRLDLEVGEVAAPGVPVLVLADIFKWRVQTNDLAETDVVLVQPGQPATVTLDAFAGQTFSGVVTEIASVAETTRGNVTYAVTIDLAPTTAALRWGMTAFADIGVGP